MGGEIHIAIKNLNLLFTNLTLLMSLKIRTEISDLVSAKDFEVKASGYTFSLAIQ